MRHLFADWKNIEGKLAAAHVYLFMDFDGTLAAIRRRPDKVGLSAGAAGLLKGILSGCEGITLGVVSGRGLRDIRRRVGIKGIVYAGNHGLEAEGPGVRFVVPEALRAKKTIRKIASELKKKCRALKGIIVEDKGLTISVHFRMASPAAAKKAKKILDNIIDPYRARKKIVVFLGKKIWEVRPPVKWDKGKAVRRLLSEKKGKLKGKVLPVYVGDDRTDEDAFRAIGKTGVCVFVGKTGRSRAAYYLMGTGEVTELLRRVRRIKGKSIK